MKLVKEESRKCRTKGHTKDVCIQNNCISNRTINVRNLEGVQGREYDLVIVNTVRTLSDDMGELSMEDKLDLGLLDDVTQFNTILTRARGWVLVIGDMDCIQNVGECSNVWYKYIEACDNAKGLFRTSEEFKNFKMKAGVTKHETEKLGKEATKGSTNRVDKIDSISSYDIKYNSSQTFITTCQHDLENSQSSFSTDIITYGTDQNVIDTNQATPQSLLQHQGQDSAPMHSQIDWTDEATSFTDIVSVTQPTDDTSPTEYNSITKL